MMLCMINALNTDETLVNKPILPSWIMHGNTSESPVEVSFASGSALALLHVVLNDPNIAAPPKLLRQRLALKAAVQCLKIEGRGDDGTQVRDAFLLTNVDDARGPGGDMLALWSHACLISLRTNTSVAGWRDKLAALLPEHMREVLPHWLDAIDDQSTQLNPIAHSVEMLSMVLRDFAREEAIALLMADIVLARALGWPHLMPLMALHMKRKPLMDIDDVSQLNLACHHGLIKSAQEAIRLTHDLARRTARLREIAPKLRAKGSDKAVELFLS